jgi:hypothetical protein
MLPNPTTKPREDAYPADLARFVCERWQDVDVLSVPGAPVANLATLEPFLSVCHHASLLREEERAVTFRAILAARDVFPVDGIPPEGLQRLEFARPFPFDPTELRRLSAATNSSRTLIGVERGDDGCFAIWGLVNSGTRWLRDVRGGRRAGAPLLPAPVVHVDAPGSIAVYKGYALVARLQSGKLSGWRADPFASEWLVRQTRGFGDEPMPLVLSVPLERPTLRSSEASVSKNRRAEVVRTRSESSARRGVA